jgi:hypothetical protein
MLGAGHGEPMRLYAAVSSASQLKTKWTRLDINEAAKPDICMDLDRIEHGAQIPARHEEFDEIHAYEILEHYGRQGEYTGFFAGFRELWRVLKPGGLLIGTTPALTSPWLWADPGHTRVITAGTLSFLLRRHYDQIGESASTDYRHLVDPCWWELEQSQVVGDRFVFALRKVSGSKGGEAI